MPLCGCGNAPCRKHILRSLDSSTLGLLPAMRTLALRPDGAAVAGGARVGLALAFDAAAGQQEQPAAGPRDVEEMAERVRYVMPLLRVSAPRGGWRGYHWRAYARCAPGTCQP